MTHAGSSAPADAATRGGPPVASARGPAADDSYDLGELFATLRRYAIRIVAATLLGLGLGLAYLLTAKTIYTAHTALYIEPKARTLVTTQNSQDIYGPDQGLVDSQAAIIGSEKVLRRVVEKLSLTTDPDFVWTGGPGPLGRLRAMLGTERPRPGVEDQALQSLAKAVRISRAPKTYVIDVEANALSPAKAAQLANAVAEAYLDDQKAAKSEEARQANALIDARLGELKTQLQAADTRVDRFKRANRILSSDGGVVTEQQLTKLNGELITARSLSAEAKAKHDQILLALEDRDGIETLPDAVKSSLVQRLREQYAQVARREAALNTQLGPRHPVLIDVRSQLSEVETQIRAELKRVAKAASSEYEIAASRERELEKSLEQTKAEVSQSNTAQIKLRELQQDADSTRELLGAFLARAKETQEQVNISTPGARVISPATPPVAPSQPFGLLVISLALVGGLGFGLASALVSDLIDRRVRTRQDVVKAAGFDIIEALPALPKSTVWFGGGGQTSTKYLSLFAALEPANTGKPGSYRKAVLALLSRLRLANANKTAPVILVCGTEAGAGTTTTTLALARAAVMQGDTVLVVDATSSDTELSQAYAATLQQDNVIVLDNPEHLRGILRHDVASGLTFLPIALADLGALKVDQRRRLASGFGTLAEANYSLTFIDAGPVLNDDGGLALLPAADSVVLVTRPGRSEKQHVRDLAAAVKPFADKVAGIVVTADQLPGA